MIAINMKMPSCCAECDMCLCLDDDYSGLCRITQTTNMDRTNSRNSDCPLIEIVTCEDCKYRDARTERDGYAYCSKKWLDTYKDHFCAEVERRE